MARNKWQVKMQEAAQQEAAKLVSHVVLFDAATVENVLQIAFLRGAVWGSGEAIAEVRRGLGIKA